MAAIGSSDRLEETSPLGILAGGSAVPMELADAVIRRGRSVHIVGIEGEAEAGIAGYPHTWVNWGGIGAMISALQAARCRQLVIVGRVCRPNLLALRPDFGFWRSIPALLPFLKGGDDTILRLVVGFFERHGLEVIGAHEAAPELLATPGPLGRHMPSREQLAEASYAASALRLIGPFDAAQAAVVGAGGLVAIEGADGTDAMLRRLADRPRLDAAGSVLVKLPKPAQERRIDMPAIGPDTVLRAAEAGLAGIAVGAGATLVAERADVVREADAGGLFVVGLDEADMSAQPIEHDLDAESDLAALSPVEALGAIGHLKAAQRHLADAEVAAHLLSSLTPFWPRACTVVSRGYVLATEGPGGALGIAERVGRLKPWGARRLHRRTGVLVISELDGELGPDPGALIVKAKASGLAGLAVLRSPRDEAGLAMLTMAADRAGLFVLAPGRAL
ncbi:MAG: LpxI family protein [Hyphomicrobiaceae bacterium]